MRAHAYPHRNRSSYGAERAGHRPHHAERHAEGGAEQGGLVQGGAAHKEHDDERGAHRRSQPGDDRLPPHRWNARTEKGARRGHESMQDEEAIVRFCAAERELAKIDEGVVVDRRRLVKNATAHREMLRDQVLATGADCVPVVCRGKQMYAHVRRRQAGGAAATVTTDRVMDVLTNGMRYEVGAALPATVEEWVEARLTEALAPPAAEAAAPRILLNTRPPTAPTAPVHPEAMARIQEAADALGATTERSRALVAQHGDRRKQLRAAAREAEQRVAEHLATHDPRHATRRVRLVPPGGGEEVTCYLRRKESVRRARPTLRTALPAVRAVVARVREASGVDATPSWETHRWLTAPHTLRALRRELDECLARLHTEKRTTRVLLSG